MKIDELMLGDWVTIAECNPTQMAIGCAKIVGIDRKISIEPYTIGFEYSFYDDKGKECIALNSCSIDRLRPIPITIDILEKNGWEECNIDLEANDKQYGITYGEFNFTWWRDVGLLGCFRDNHEKELQYEMIIELPIRYVHELQHALKLVKIEKEIKI